MKKPTCLLSVFMLLTVFSGLLLTYSARADSSIYFTRIVIQSDGSVVPETEYIQKAGNVYTLTKDLFGRNSLTICCSNIVFDGAGHSISGGVPDEQKDAAKYFWYAGLDLQNVNNVTVKNVAVGGFSYYYQMGLSDCFNCSLVNVNTSLSLSNCGFNNISKSTLWLDMGNSNYTFVNRCNVNLTIANSFRNTILENNVRLSIDSGSENLIYKNNIMPFYYGYYQDVLADIFPNNFWDNGEFGNYWSDYQTKYPNATEIGDTGIADTPYLVGSGYFDNFPLMYPIEQMYLKQTPRINITCNESSNYAGDFPLNFTVDGSTSWLGYSLDGKNNVTITGNTTLTSLAEGNHTLIVYATSTFGVDGASSPTSFIIVKQEDLFVSLPFSMLLVVGVAAGLVAVIAYSLLVFYKKNGAER